MSRRKHDICLCLHTHVVSIEWLNVVLFLPAINKYRYRYNKYNTATRHRLKTESVNEPRVQTGHAPGSAPCMEPASDGHQCCRHGVPFMLGVHKIKFNRFERGLQRKSCYHNQINTVSLLFYYKQPYNRLDSR